MDLHPSAHLAHYELLEQLGAGGMGIVWKARDLRLDRIVALKILRATLARDPGAFEQFQREARALAVVQHPAIVTIYSVEQDEGVPFLTMEFVDGTTLSRHVPPDGLSIAGFYELAVPLVAAVAVAHGRGVMHRDLKPGNIMVTADRGVKVLDFGLAAMLQAEAVLPGTRATSADSQGAGVRGTPPFMSPEQVMGRRVDQRSDLFSLGAVLYFMLAGHEPFPGQTTGEIFASVLRDDPAPLDTLRTDVSLALSQIVAQCLQKEPARRPTTAVAVERALANARDLDPVSDRNVRSVAVLPFDDLSPEKDQAYFCEGIAEEIILALTGIAGLQVASRSAAFLARATTPDRQALATLLGVETLLEGSVRKSGPRVRISVGLVDVASGFNLWTARYDREMQDIFAIQEEIAAQVAEVLRGGLTLGERRALRDRPTPQIHAYDFYLRGRKYYFQYSRKGVEFALSMFQRAAEIDPGYARAHAGIAQCHAYRYLYAGRHAEDCAAADAASARALALSPESADAHAARGLALSVQHRDDEATREFADAIRLNPELFDAYYFSARVCFAAGRLQEAVSFWERAGQIRPDDYQSPLLVAQAYEHLGDAASAARSRREGVARAEEHLKLQPDDVRALYMGANGLVALGEATRGLEWARQAAELEPEDAMVLYNVGCIYAMAGKADDALACLEACVARGLVQKAWFEQDSNLDALRALPRFERLMASLSEAPVQ